MARLGRAHVLVKLRDGLPFCEETGLYLLQARHMNVEALFSFFSITLVSLRSGRRGVLCNQLWWPQPSQR